MSRRWISIAVFVCVASLAGGAESVAPTISPASLGFNGQFQNRHWTPLRVLIANPGPARTLHVVAETTGFVSRQLTAYSRPVWLPAHATRTVTFPVFPDVNENPPRKKSGDNSFVVAFNVKLTDPTGRVWDQQPVGGRVLPEDIFHILVADERLTSYRLPEEHTGAGLRRRVVRSVVRPKDLPARALEYDGVAMIVLGDLGDHQLSPLQSGALRAWVQAGGALVVVPGPAGNIPTGLNDLLPAEYFGPDRIATDRQFTRWGPAPLFAEGLPIVRMAPRGGRVVAGAAAAPLAVTQPVGAGAVVAVGFDAGNEQFQQWPGATAFLTELLNPCAGLRPNADRILEQSGAVDRLMSGLAGIKVPGRRAVFMYLMLAVAGLLAVLVACRFSRAPERGWWLASLVAVATGSAVILAATHWKNQPLPFLNEIAVAFVSPDSQTAAVHAALGLYSPWAAHYALAAPSLRPGPSRTTPPERIGFEYADRLRLADLPTRAQDLRVLYGQAAITGRFARAALQLGPTGLRATVTNPGSEPLEDCFLKLNRLVVPVGDLAPGASWTREGLRGTGEFSSRALRTADDERRRHLRALFFPDPIYILGGNEDNLPAVLRARQWLAGWPTVVGGWSNRPHFPITELDAAVARRAQELWLLRPPLTVTGPRVLLPKGALALRLTNPEAKTFERAEGRFSGTRAAFIIAEFALPAECPDLRVESARLFLEFRGTAWRCDVAEAADPVQAYNPATRSFTLHITIRPAGPKPAESAVNYWQIRDLDLEVGGTIP